MATESDIVQRESGGDPYVGYSGVDLSKAPLNKYGFPIWSGAMGPEGISHAAGLYQFEPKTWEEGASALGITDFSPASQKKVYDYTHAKYGDAPWAASEPGHLQREGFYGGALHVNVKPDEDLGISPDSAALLSSILAQHYPSEDKSTGNSLLDSIMQSNVFGFAGGEEQKKPLDLKPLEQATPHVAQPQTVAALQEQPVITQPLTQPSAPAIPPPAPNQQPAPQTVPHPPTEEFIEPPGKGQQVPAFPTAPQTMPRPVIQPGPQINAASLIPANLPEQLKKTGNAILDHILSSPKRLIGPHAAASLIGNLLTQPDQKLGADVPIEAQTPEQKANTLAQAVSSLPRELGGILARPFQQGGEDVKQAVTQGVMPEPSQALSDAMVASAGSIGRGGFGAGPRLPARIEPPPIAEAPRIGQSTDLVPFSRGGQPPALPPTGVARVPGAEPPPQGPGMAPPGKATIDEPRPPKGDANESAPVKAMRLEAMRSTQDKLFRSWTRASEYQNRLLKAMQGLPRLTGEQKLQIERYLEWQPGMPQVAIDSEAKRIADQVIKPMRDRAARDWTYLKTKGVTDSLPPDVEADLTEGYLHRMRVNRPRERHPFEPFGGVRGLRRTTSSMQGRKFYVVQDMKGNRHIYQGEPPPYGTELKDPSGQKYGEVRRATTEEIEQNSDTRYLHDPVLASMQNMAQLHIARQNFDLLHNEILPELKDAGLATTDREAARRLGQKATQVPSLHGWYFEPRTANAFDDFHRTPSIVHDDVAGALHWLGDINHTAISLLFLNPLGHMRNVAADYALSRGDLWWNPASYAGMARHTRDALNDVIKDTPFYHDVQRAGGALMGAGNQNRILYQALVNRARKDMTALPWLDNVAKQTGVWNSAKEMAHGIWNASQKVMWGFHDMLLLARVRELMQTKQIPIEEAVRQAERHIADYRVPASVGEGSLKLPQGTARGLSRLMQDRTVTVFGRYHYNKLKAIGNVLGDASRAMTRQGIPMKDRVEAIGRLGSLLVWSTILQGGLNYIVQQVTGNPYAHVTVPGAMGIPANVARVANDLAFKRDMGQAAYDFWMGMASIVTPMPALGEFISQATNRNFPYSEAPVRGSQLPAHKQLIQSGAHAAGTLLPPVEDLSNWRRALSSSAGISLPDPIAAARAQKPRRQEFKSESRRFNRQFGF